MHKQADPEPTFHYVCTHEEAKKKIADHDIFWVSNCGCREGKKGEEGEEGEEGGEGCKRSRMDLCLFFDDKEMTGTGTGWKKVDRAFVEGILKEAKEKHLVARPFHYNEDREHDQGICFCCDDCCAYFQGDEWGCDPGKYIEQTDMEACTHCGECVSVCYFKARNIVDGMLQVTREKKEGGYGRYGCYGCYGCGLCSDVCPVGCIEMVPRDGN